MKEKIVVTGASGFIGSWLCRYLLHAGYDVSAVTTNIGNPARLINFPKNRLFCVEMISWHEVVKTLRPKVLISADWEGVDSSRRNIEEVQYGNVKRISDFVRKCKVDSIDTFITFGSQAENGPINVAAQEKNYDLATTAYGKAKIELRNNLSSNLHKSSIRFVWARVFSTYGPFDNPSWLLPSLIESLKNDRHFSLTSGNQTWSFLHVLDLCTAIEKCIRNLSIKDIVNVGNPETELIQTYAKTLAGQMKKEHLLRFGSSQYRPDQVMYLKPITKKLEELNWKPSVNVRQGFADLVEWHLTGYSDLARISRSSNQEPSWL